ncbi:MAG: CapA family protein [Myxococcales bacterium]
MKKTLWMGGSLLGLTLLGASALQSPAQAAAANCPAFTWQSLWYGLEWSILAFAPSTQNQAGVQGIPPADELATGTRDRSTEKRILLFGDLLPMQKDTPPRASPEVRALFASADLILGNIESPVYQIKTWYTQHGLDLNADQTGDFHASTGFVRSFMDQYCMNPAKAVFTVANNHAGDRDQAGWDETVRATAAMGVRGIVGTRTSSDGSGRASMGSFDLGAGLKVGVVGWTQEENCPLDNAWARYADIDAAGANAVNWNTLKQQNGIDLLIGIPHWGPQFHFYPEAAIYDEAESLTARGFDLISGTGPSVLQPAELFPGGITFFSQGSVNANFSLNGTTFLIPVVEILVDPAGRVVEYNVHAFAQRKVSTSLPSLIVCPDGRWVTDQARATDWEVVPLEQISNTWGTRDALQRDLDRVFPR